MLRRVDQCQNSFAINIRGKKHHESKLKCQANKSKAVPNLFNKTDDSCCSTDVAAAGFLSPVCILSSNSL